MAQRGSKMSLALVFTAAMWACSSAQPTCQPPIISLQPCITYMTSNATTPPPQCCTQLASLIQTQAQCLCTFLNAAPQLPLPINRNQAINLPGACNIQAPPLSQCNAPSGLVPTAPAAGSPQGAPGSASPATPSDASAPSGPSDVSPPSPSTTSTTGVPVSKGGSKAGPTKGQATSSARSSTKFAPSIFFFVLVASALYSF